MAKGELSSFALPEEGEMRRAIASLANQYWTTPATALVPNKALSVPVNLDALDPSVAREAKSKSPPTG